MNYYEILNLTKNASQKEIKESYKKLVKKYHPDIYVGDKSYAEKKIKEINSAYDVLSNEELKKEYDLSISPNYYTDINNDLYNTENETDSSYENYYTPTENYYPDDKYEKYKEVYNNYLNKKHSKQSSSYVTTEKENYSNFYKSSAYKNSCKTTNYDNKPESTVQKTISSLSLSYIFVFIFIIYILVILFIFADLKKIDEYRNRPSITSSSTQSENFDYSKYKDYYVINNYKITIQELHFIYAYYYSDSYKDFDAFMTDFLEYYNTL